LAKKVDGQVFKNSEVNQFDQAIGSNNLVAKEAEQIFKAEPGTVLDFGNPGTIYLVKVIGKKAGQEKTPEQIKAEMGNQSQLISRRVREELMKALNNKAKIVTNQSLL
jgi:parvulin-like peptidyl-prolyl isomerase